MSEIPETTLHRPSGPVASDPKRSLWATVVPDDTPPPMIHLRDDRDERTARRVSDDPSSRSGRYEILGEIARGGMGAVLHGRDSELNRELAVKVLLEQYRDNPDVLRRFFEEAQIGGQLQHPGIVPIYDLGTFDDKRPFFAMKLVKGRTLDALLKARDTPADDLPRFLAIFEQVAQTVAYAHSRSVIHRDLKPMNIMVGAFGEVQVMDWGLAKVLTGEPSTTEAGLAEDRLMEVIRTARTDSKIDASVVGSVMGTPAYMPPEQAKGEIGRVDERADVFGLGAILCEILTGSPAYTGKTFGEVIRKAESADLSETKARLESCGADTDLIALVVRCLAPEPTDRPRDASAVAAAMQEHLSSVQKRLRDAELARVEADSRAQAEHMKALAERSRRKMTMALAASLLLAGLIGGGSWLAFRLNRQAQQAKADNIVGDALARAETMKADAEDEGPEALTDWEMALDAAEKAGDAVAGLSPRPDLVARVRSLVAELTRRTEEVRERVAKSEAIRTLADRLDEARLEAATIKDGHFDTEAKLKAYLAAFEKAGVELDRQTPEDVAKSLGARPEVKRIAAAIDDWGGEGVVAPERRKALSAIAHLIDPEGNEIRDAIASKDRAKLLALSRDVAIRNVPAASITSLADALRSLGESAAAVDFLFRAQRQYPSDFWINHNLAIFSLSLTPPRQEDAVRFLTVAVALKPRSAGALHDLGITLDRVGKVDEAISAFREAIQIQPDLAITRLSLGNALIAAKKPEDAIASYREAIRIRPDYAEAYANLGNALGSVGKKAEAIPAYREAIRINPDYALARALLGDTLAALGKPEEAIASYREAIRITPGNPGLYLALGNVFAGLGEFSEAIDAYRQSTQVQPDYALGLYNLGYTLYRFGAYDEALAALKRSHDLGSKQPNWKHPTATLIADLERLTQLQDKLPSILAEAAPPADNSRRLELAQACYNTRRFASAVRFWQDALANNPRLADDRNIQYRYKAARAAAMASAGQGDDVQTTGEASRAELRKTAYKWLRAELSVWKKLTLTVGLGNRQTVARTLKRWKADVDLAPIRDAEALAKLPEAERAEWQALWADVDALLAKLAKT